MSEEMVMPIPNHAYKGVCVRVIDGDTYVIDVDLGFTSHVHVKIRLRGIDVYERSTVKGKQAMAYLQQLLIPSGLSPTKLTIQSLKDSRSFERWVADVWWGDGGEPLAETLRKAGYEKPII